MFDLTSIARDYLATFSNKDLKGLGERFSDDVTLRDWNVGMVRGKEAVLAANKGIFDSVKTIEARPLKIYTDGSTVVAELDVRVDGGAPLLVVDVIEVNEAGKIRAIRAYRGA